ncbi:MAG TPA: hypothetical protein VES38_06145 [Methylotenera sp.]|nr:hypothetical protein [Methylotenera sp.]
MLIDNPVQVFLTVVALVFLGIFYQSFITNRREQYIREAAFPQGLLQKLIKKHPKLNAQDTHLVSKALRQYFLTYHKSKYKHVSMPSEVVDDLWHEFILYTRNYERFCKQAFGRFFHHTPAVVLGNDKKNNAGLRRTWWHTCKEENINPQNASRLPLLFAIDSKLGIAHGRTYALNCKENSHLTGGSTCCVGDFSSSSVDGGTDGFGDASGDGGSDGGCSGGCGGGGD